MFSGAVVIALFAQSSLNVPFSQDARHLGAGRLHDVEFAVPLRHHDTGDHTPVFAEGQERPLEAATDAG